MILPKLVVPAFLLAASAVGAETQVANATTLNRRGHFKNELEACEIIPRTQCDARFDCAFDDAQRACQPNLAGRAERAFNSWFPGCHFHFFCVFMTLLTTAFLTLRSIFRYPCMPKFLRADPGFMAYTLLSGMTITVLAAVGVMGAYRHWGEPGWDTPLARLTVNTPEGDVVAQIHATYQLWNLAMAIIRGDGLVSIVHHLFCTYLGFINSEGFGCYHLIYMGGVAEISTMILTVMDIFKNNKYLQEDYPVANAYTRYTFCAVFLLLRVVVWFVVLQSFFSDIYAYLSQGLGDGKFTLHCYVNVLAMLILTFIQLIWARLVVLGILKALGIIKRKPSAEQAISASRKSSVSTECSTTESASKKASVKNPTKAASETKKRR